MTTPENNETGRPSFLDTILADWASSTEASSASTEVVIPPVAPVQEAVVPLGATPPATTPPIPPTPPPPPPKKREPMKPAQFMKIIGALFLVALIFFGSFLAYIVFNPGEARFFIRFGINPSQVATLLSNLVNGIFGSITFILSVTWVIFLFRAIITKKEYRKQKTVYFIISAFIGIILFSHIGFWAFLFQKIGASDFVNPNGGVIAYDNDLYLSERFKDSSEIIDFSNMIGPITIRYDLSSDVKFASKTIEIDGYEVDFDGDGTIDKKGSNPASDKSIIYTYDRKGKFTPKGTYSGYDTVTREWKVVPIVFEPINLVGAIDINSTDKNVVFDATELKAFGNMAWYTSDNLDVVASREPLFTTKIEKADKFVCLSIASDSKKKDSCDRVYFVKSKEDAPISATIKYTSDPVDVRKVFFSLADKKSKSGWEIESVKWLLDDSTTISNEESFENSFSNYGTFKISAILRDTAGNTVTITERVTLKAPLTLIRNSNSDSMIKVTNDAGDSLLNGTYSTDLRAYKIENLTIPSNLKFDASDVRVRNPGYELTDVEWDFNGEEKKWLTVNQEFVVEKRYEINVKYFFEKQWSEERLNATEKIIIEGKKEEISPSFKLVLPEWQNDVDSLYATVKITFDGSASSVRSGKISKFIYDFGEGKEPSEGDAVKTYAYYIPGEYTATLTIVKDDGTKASTSRKIIIKEVPKKLSLHSSISSGKVGMSVDFDSFGSVGQIDKYEWDFGDGTPTSTEANPTHIFEKAGTYQVKLSVTYVDGTVRNATLDMQVNE